MTRTVKVLTENSSIYVITIYHLIISQQVNELSTIFISKRYSQPSDYLLSECYTEDTLLCITAVAVITNILCRQQTLDAL